MRYVLFLGLLLLVLLLSTSGCAEAVEEPVPGPATSQRALELQLGELQASHDTLQAAYDANSITLRDILMDWNTARVQYEAAKASCDDAKSDRSKYMTELTECLVVRDIYIKDIFNLEAELNARDVRYQALVDRLYVLKSRQNYTVSSNFTSAEQAVFYKIYDKLYQELISQGVGIDE